MLKIFFFLTPLLMFSKVELIPNNDVLLSHEFNSIFMNGKDWFNQSPQESTVHGISVDKTYDAFGEPGTEIIVAVIDSGVDVNHEDLKGKIWINKDEIPNNNKDDDGNGYIDDYYGWNFLGSKKGMGKVLSDGTFKKGEGKYQADKENLEFAREIKRLQSLNRDLTTKEQAYLKKLKDYSKSSPYCLYGSYDPEMKHYCDINFQSEARKLIEKEKRKGKYGNNDIIGPDSMHGTHVAGIIAANRKNSLGIKGVASNAKIMAIRAIPNGDERDDDVANAIRYAVDNGAKIINMSFGKAFGSDKKLVEEATLYAREKGVLLVHAAGNDGKENTANNNFPNHFMISANKIASNWLEVGASSAKNNSSLSASFSNYSKTIVDLFAPGVAVYSTLPDNKYKALSGTSMASPVVSGAAALLLGYMPSLSPEKIRFIFIDSSRQYSTQVSKPLLGPFKNLSVSGGILDIYNALSETF